MPPPRVVVSVDTSRDESRPGGVAIGRRDAPPPVVVLIDTSGGEWVGRRSEGEEMGMDGAWHGVHEGREGIPYAGVSTRGRDGLQWIEKQTDSRRKKLLQKERKVGEWIARRFAIDTILPQIASVASERGGGGEGASRWGGSSGC